MCLRAFKTTGETDLNEELKAALLEITADVSSNSQCWAMGLPEDALELLYALEELIRDGKRVNRRIAAEKFNELYTLTGKPVSAGMIGHHLNSIPDKGCVCQKVRNFL